jgi:hypothetical protein
LFLTGCVITVGIKAPGEGATIEEGLEINFSGTASDSIEGELTGASLVWTSSLDGEIGTGTTFEKDDLTVGTHIITLTATNSLDQTKTETISITIIPKIPTPEMQTNFHNNLTRGGRNFTAKLSCDDVTVESYTGNLSDCQEVSEYCGCRLYASGDYIGSFSGCVELQDYCSLDATLILTLNGKNPALSYKCVDICGDSLRSPSDFLSDGDLPDAFLDTEVLQEPFELHLDY